ncbi:MAG: right-handed parallel beta-helix repeat-containing protein, partial [Planctomycetes bacterium]|nr:right-handed parallel beta-helix repeat-containing protein [Planctomycetota bacterium]
MRTSRSILVILLVLSAPGPAWAQTTWHVDDDCAPPGVGTEADPFCTIQQGVDTASNGDKVLVHPGTYTGNGNRDISLFGKEITLTSIAGPEATTIDIQGGPSSIHRGFFLIHGETFRTVIAGFTITNGYLIGDTGGSGDLGGGGGAGIYLRDSSPRIQDCIIRDNVSATLHVLFVRDGRGAGIYADGDCDAVIENCVLSGNSSDKRGGAMYLGYENSSVTVRQCLITDNAGLLGGGIHHTFGTATIANNVIVNNWANGGGGIKNEDGEPFVTNCILWGNTATAGEQILIQGSVMTIEYSDVQGGLEGVGATP